MLRGSRAARGGKGTRAQRSQAHEQGVEFGHGHAGHGQGQAEQGDPGQAEQHAAGFAPAVVQCRG
jgi:hypothetical protein